MNKITTVIDGQKWSVDLDQNTRTMIDNSGRTVTMDLGQADVHIDAALAGYAARYTQWEGIADQVSPVVHSSKASDKYYTWDKDDVFQNVEDLAVAPGGNVKEVTGRLSNTAFATQAFGLGTSVPLELQSNADAPLSIEIAYTKRVLDAISLGREVRVQNMVSTAANWTGGYTVTLGATQKWNGGSASDPVQDLYTAIESSLTPVTGIAMSERTYHAFITNANVQKYVAQKVSVPPLPSINAGQQTQISQELSGLLNLPPFLIGRMKRKLTTSTYGFVWGNDVELLYSTPGLPMMISPSTTKTFRWTGADGNVPDGVQQGGFLVRTFFEPKRGPRGSRTVIVTHNDIEVMTSTVAGGLIKAAYQ